MQTKKRFLRSLIAIIILVTSIIVPVSPVFAEDEKLVGLEIFPYANRVSIKPGDESTYKMEVKNSCPKKTKVRVYAAPYTIVNENHDYDITTETEHTQISRWVAINQNVVATKDSEKKWSNEAIFELDPGASQEVEYKITAPKNISDGGQYAAIFAESIPDDESAAAGVKMISRVGMILYGNTNGETIGGAEISNVSMDTFLTGGKITAEANIGNRGNTDFTASIKMEINNFIGGIVAEENKLFLVIPDSPTRHAKLEWKDTPVFGIFRVKVIVSALDQNTVIEKTVLIMPVYIIITIIVLLVVIIVWLIILIRNSRTESRIPSHKSRQKRKPQSRASAQNRR